MGDDDEEIEAFNARVDEEIATTEAMRAKGARGFFPNQYFREHKSFSLGKQITDFFIALLMSLVFLAALGGIGYLCFDKYIKKESEPPKAELPPKTAFQRFTGAFDKKPKPLLDDRTRFEKFKDRVGLKRHDDSTMSELR